MAIYKTSHSYSAINTAIFYTNISLAAKGLLAYFLTKPRGWTMDMDAICNELQENSKDISRIIDELIDNNFCIKSPQFDAQGGFVKDEYVFSYSGLA